MVNLNFYLCCGKLSLIFYDALREHTRKISVFSGRTNTKRRKKIWITLKVYRVGGGGGGYLDLSGSTTKKNQIFMCLPLSCRIQGFYSTATEEFLKRFRMISDQFFVTLYALSIPQDTISWSDIIRTLFVNSLVAGWVWVLTRTKHFYTDQIFVHGLKFITG